MTAKYVQRDATSTVPAPIVQTRTLGNIALSSTSLLGDDEKNGASAF